MAVSNGRQRPSGAEDSRWRVPVGSTNMSPGISGSGSPSSRRSQATPDPNAQAMSEIWWSDSKAFERAFAGAVEER
jgi:hypothetical protein